MVQVWKELTDRLRRSESLVFALAVIINLVPALSCRYFPTVDGPVHLYNARLILELLSGDSDTISAYFSFNPVVTPNWVSHFVLALLLKLSGPMLAEKCVLIFFLAGMPLAFRYAVLSAGAKPSPFIYLIFPFTYSYLFYYGVYNFNFALVFMFLSLGAWFSLKKDTSKRTSIRFAGCVLLLCLSHFFIFTVFVLVLIILNLLEMIREFRKGTKKIPFRFIGVQALSVLPGSLILIPFLMNKRESPNELSRLSAHDIYFSYKYMMPMKGIGFDAYAWPVRALTLLVLSAVIYYFVQLIRKRDKTRPLHFSWPLICLLILSLSFLVPDDLFNFGFITVRFMYLFFLFLLFWLCVSEFSFVLNAAAGIIAGYLVIFTCLHNLSATKTHSDLAAAIVKAAEAIPPGSVVYPVNLSGDRMQVHFSSYAGVEQGRVVLDNYEANLKNFPLIWNQDRMKEPKIGDVDLFTCAGDPRPLGKISKNVEYVLWIGPGDEKRKWACERELRAALGSGYEPIQNMGNAKVMIFRSKSM